jgi:hypothetical protein
VTARGARPTLAASLDEELAIGIREILVLLLEPLHLGERGADARAVLLRT